MEADRRKPDDEMIENILSGFNAEEILDDPDDLDPKNREKPEPAATPDSPNPI